ncbi:alpha/beta hydrolase [Flavobacterium amniphilum]|uniref:alpha/beta hydrolase n=1 Tax=Flavobacterium amniphilum TaxID=1834035 RepID=UPI00202AC124|nr:alpha/beta hydrolase [Flavobacterium amniphilum]MCL9804207.1 alpha/beta hydrolase [Flavobacterium amniphilum]
MKKWSKWKIFKTVWFSFITVFFIWNWTTFQSRNLPDDTFENAGGVTVTESDDVITFRPNTTNKKSEVIFFQGGLTDPKAYAPLCRKLAENGFCCHLVKMNWRLPQYDYQKVLRLFDLKKGNYVIGGHSQGAKMAAQIVYEHPDLFKGLFIMGTSHPRDINLSEMIIPALKLYAENDGLASVAEVMENRDKLPKDTELVLIRGGNHSQFGYLGTLLMDNEAAISLEEQQRQTFNDILGFLDKIPSPASRDNIAEN